MKAFEYEDVQELILENMELARKIVDVNNVSLERATLEIRYMSQMLDEWLQNTNVPLKDYWNEFYTTKKAWKIKRKTWLESMKPSGDGIALVRTRVKLKKKAVLRRVYDDWTTLTQYTIFMQILTSGKMTKNTVRQNLRSGLSMVWWDAIDAVELVQRGRDMWDLSLTRFNALGLRQVLLAGENTSGLSITDVTSNKWRLVKSKRKARRIKFCLRCSTDDEIQVRKALTDVMGRAWAHEMDTMRLS